MKPETKRARMARLFGIELPPEPTREERLHQDNVSREAESVVAYYIEPKGFVNRLCKTCELEFAVNRANIAFCSDDCRGKYLREVMGLDWDATARTPEDRWAPQTGGREPLVVPPTALALLTQSHEEGQSPLQDDAVAG